MKLLDMLGPNGAARREAGRLAAFSALLLLAQPAGAQQTLAGRVMLGAAPFPGATVELHRVTPTERGMVRRLTADAAGRFAVTLPAPADSGFTVYFATAIANGVRYVGPALHGGEVPRQYVIEVFDTTSSAKLADSVRVVRRDVILAGAGDGGWEVAELVRLRNPTRRTLVPGHERPVVSMPIPEGSTAFEAGEGEPQDSARAGRTADLVRVGGNAWVGVPFVPGDRDFIFRYRLPARPQRVRLPLGRPTDSLTIYVRQPAPDARISGIPEGPAFAAEGESFRRYEAAGVRPGAEIFLDWRGPTPPPVDPRWAALAIAGLVLAAGGWLAWRRPRAR